MTNFYFLKIHSTQRFNQKYSKTIKKKPQILIKPNYLPYPNILSSVIPKQNIKSQMKTKRNIAVVIRLKAYFYRINYCVLQINQRMKVVDIECLRDTVR
jgi:hypothetical protein